MKNFTFTIIKPDAVSNGYTGKILDLIIQNNFKVKALKMLQLSKEEAEKFYIIHKERPFYKELVDFMISGPLVVACLEKTNAVLDFRTLIGATDPAEADNGTIRKLYAENKGRNAVHGSDSDENALLEINFFFSQIELVS